MLLREHFAELADWDIRIIGTDLSCEAIEYAKRGRYRRMEVNRGLPARMLLKYLAREGDEWEIAPELRTMCEFAQADLCAPLPELPGFDLVLLRNVLLQLPQRDVSSVFYQGVRADEPERRADPGLGRAGGGLDRPVPHATEYGPGWLVLQACRGQTDAAGARLARREFLRMQERFAGDCYRI